MIKCPVCRKEINELDESCPHCHIKFEDMEDEVSEVIEQLQEDEAVESENLHKGTYLSSSYTETVANWFGIIGGIAVLIGGFTLFFLLKTIVDIYRKVKKCRRG